MGVCGGVCNLPKIREPFHQLCCIIFVELYIRKVHLEHRWARVAHPEKHQLGLAQVHRCQCRRVQRSQGFAMIAKCIYVVYNMVYGYYSQCSFHPRKFPRSCQVCGWGAKPKSWRRGMSNFAVALSSVAKAAINANNEHLRALCSVMREDSRKEGWVLWKGALSLPLAVGWLKTQNCENRENWQAASCNEIWLLYKLLKLEAYYSLN